MTTTPGKARLTLARRCTGQKKRRRRCGDNETRCGDDEPQLYYPPSRKTPAGTQQRAGAAVVLRGVPK